MPHELLDLTVEEVSGVDKAANRRTFLIIKQADGASDAAAADTDPAEGAGDIEKQYPENSTPPLTTGEIVAQQEAMETLCRLKGVMQESMYRIFECAPLADQPNLLLQSVQEFAAYARQAIAQMGALQKASDLLEELEAFTKAGRKISASRMRRLKTIMAELEAIMLEGMDETEKRDNPESPEDHTGDEPMNKTATEQEQITALTKRAETAEADAATLSKKWDEAQERTNEVLKKLDEAMAEITKLQAQVDANDPEAIWKGVSPQLRARIEKAEAERDEERNARLRLDYIAKATAFKALPLSVDDDWEVFKDLSTLPPKSQRRLEAWLKAGTEAMKYSGLFKEIGRAGTGEYKGDALEEIEKLAQERVEKGLSKTRAQAMDAVLDERPELYKAYKHERQGGAR